LPSDAEAVQQLGAATSAHALSAVLPAAHASRNTLIAPANLTQWAGVASSADAYTGVIAALPDSHAWFPLHCPDQQLMSSCPGCQLHRN